MEENKLAQAMNDGRVKIEIKVLIDDECVMEASSYFIDDAITQLGIAEQSILPRELERLDADNE